MVNFDFNKTLKRAMEVLDEKIELVMKPNPNEKKRYTKDGFFMKYKFDFPMSKHTYYKYKRSALNGMTLETFYQICRYTGVSADYLLGFIDTKRKEQSAEMVRKEFGLSDAAMEKILEIKNDYKLAIKYHNTPTISKRDLLNYMIVNFFQEFAYYVDKYCHVMDNGHLSPNELFHTLDEYYPLDSKGMNVRLNGNQHARNLAYLNKYKITQLMNHFLDEYWRDRKKIKRKKEADE